MKNMITSRQDDRSEIFTTVMLERLIVVLEQQDALILLSSQKATEFLKLQHSKLLGNTRCQILNLLEDVQNAIEEVE